MFRLVPCIVLVLATCHVQEAIQDRHTLVEALCRHFCQLIPHVICISVENFFAERFLCQGRASTDCEYHLEASAYLCSA